MNDWDEAPCTTILQQIHRSAPADARLFLVESVMPDNSQPEARKR